jgi:hypothetical protein
MIIIDKIKRVCQIVDFAVPYDTRVNTKEVEKIEKYQDLARELGKPWKISESGHHSSNYIRTLRTTPEHICKWTT